MNIVNLFKARGRPADRFEQIIRPHIETLYRFAYRLCNSRDDAEELVQLLLIRLFPKLQQLESIEKLSPWLCRGLHNLYIDSYRSVMRQSTLFDFESDGDNVVSDQVTPFEHVSGKELMTRIDAALNQLNDDQRILVLLHDSEGYTLNELTDILQVPLGTLKSRLNRARTNLKKLLSREPPGGLDRVTDSRR
jgi:RNA polymerase sigma-70 factor (ECF subfamily)